MNQLTQKQENISSEHPNDSYLRKAWASIERMTPGKRIIIKEVEPNFPELLVTACKMWMQVYGFNHIEFNADYSVLRVINKLDPK